MNMLELLQLHHIELAATAALWAGSHFAYASLCADTEAAHRTMKFYGSVFVFVLCFAFIAKDFSNVEKMAYRRRIENANKLDFVSRYWRLFALWREMHSFIFYPDFFVWRLCFAAFTIPLASLLLRSFL